MATRWETVIEQTPQTDDSDYLERVRVPGGWLYRSLWREDKQPLAGKKPAVAMAMCFVPDPSGRGLT